MKKLGFWLMLVAVGALTLGCEISSDKSDDEYDSFVFINDTGKRIQVSRSGGPDWESATSFQLVGQGAERTVNLKEKGKISYTYAVLDSGEVKVRQSGREIFFRYD